MGTVGEQCWRAQTLYFEQILFGRIHTDICYKRKITDKRKKNLLQFLSVV